MGHAAIGLIGGVIGALLAQAAPDSLGNRWLVLGKTHATPEAAEKQADEIRKRHTDVQVIATDHYANLAPGRYALVFFALADKSEARRRQRALWTLGHEPWIRWSGAYVAHPSKKSLRFRKQRLTTPATGSQTAEPRR